ncbi:dephospho-CoA kinase [Eisenibacter elegans]|uniref:dephospho-CoA kinase n=1 Tax=Eisenibacter elegans TaxID=997 RepID=UPI00042774BF|nr:dephospho-CoA kinase [Eisenibacter elegans]
MTSVKKIGITGGIGAGKSIVCKVFAALGIPIYSADERAKWLMSHDATLVEGVKAAFGTESYFPDGTLNRAYLAKTVFVDTQHIATLNALVHPRVGEDYRAWVQTQNKAPYTLNEAALMFESGRYQDLDKVITVFAPEALRIRRIRHRDPQRSEAEIAGIIAKQMNEADKCARADWIIHNDDQQLVIPQVLAIHQAILAL